MITKKDWKIFIEFAKEAKQYGSLYINDELIAFIKDDKMFGLKKRKTVFDEPERFIFKHPDSFKDKNYTKKQLYESLKIETNLHSIKTLFKLKSFKNK